MENNQQTGPEQGSVRITWEDCCSLAGGMVDDVSLAVKVEPNVSGVTARSGWLYLIADGLGSEGIDAAHYVLERVKEEYYRQNTVIPGDRLRIIFRSIGTQLFSRAEKEGISVNPVDLTAAVIFNGEITIANAGGNRAYLIHDEEAQLITHDPSRLNEMLRKGIFTLEEAQNAARQQKFYKRLGDQAESEVDIIENIPVIPGDMLLLCNQYLAQRIDDEDSSLLENCNDPEEICNTLTSGWDFADSEQNIVLLALKFEEEIPEIAEEDEFGEFIPIAPPVQTHFRPAPAFVQRPIRAMRTNSRYSAWFYFLILMCIVGISLFGWMIYNSRQNSLEARFSSAQTAVITSPGVVATRTITALPSPTLSSQSTEQVTPTTAETPDTQISAAAPVLTEGSVCVWEIEKGNSLYSTIRKFDLAYKDTETYFYLADCDLTKGICTGEKKEIESHSKIDSGWFVIIPVADQAACKTGQGVWVKLNPPAQ
jgi:PPM family protein phosphatase